MPVVEIRELIFYSCGAGSGLRSYLISRLNLLAVSESIGGGKKSKEDWISMCHRYPISY